MNPLISPNGHVARSPVSMEPPKGQAKYFGFFILDTPHTVLVEEIIAMFPNVKDGGYQIILRGGIQMNMPNEDGLRLMKTFGWRDASAIERV